MPAVARSFPWIFGLAVLILGLVATLVTVPCPDAHSATPSLSAASAPERGASLAPSNSPDPCGDTEAHRFTSVPSAGAAVAVAKAPEGQAATAVDADRHRSAALLLACAGRRTSWCTPASLAIADLAVTRI